MFSAQIRKIAAEAEVRSLPGFAAVDSVAQQRTEQLLAAFSRQRVSEQCFNMSTGYGYGDVGRDRLDEVYADVFGAEKALVRINFVNGTHAIACAMLACLKPGDVMLSATGPVYDTLRTLVGQDSTTPGSFAERGIGYREVPMCAGVPDYAAIRTAALKQDVAAVFIQRSRGYSQRKSLSCSDIGEIVSNVRDVNRNAVIIVDNCYGEFCEPEEPLAFGANLICGSLIKNPGGGLAPAGGYIAGRADLVDRAAQCLTVPGIGGECGPSLGFNRALYQGFFMAPHTVAQALKTAIFCASAMHGLGYTVSPEPLEARRDIIQTIRFGEPAPLLAFCRGIQAGAPVDSFATPEPWDMPGYDCPVVMAAGAFVQGASIELSCDAPMRPPYTAFLQGGLTYESGKIGVMRAIAHILGEQV